ncbi:MAG: phage tail protein [Cyanobacteria bacterium P01_D01_bin.115]
MANTLATTGSSKFYISWEGIEELPIKSITEVKYEAKTTGGQAPLECGKGGRTNRQSSSGGFDSSPTLTVEVYLSGDATSASRLMHDWFNQAKPASDLGEGDWANSRKSGSVVLYSPDGDQEIVRWNFVQAWIKNYSLGDADATGEELAVESYEFVCEKVDKVLAGGDPRTSTVAAAAA